MNYSNKFCFTQNKENTWVVSMYEKEGENGAKLIKEASFPSKEEADKAAKEFLQ